MAARIFRSLDEVLPDFGPSVLTIGNFDGVHTGHRRIFRRVRDLAAAHGWKPSVLTFDPHPTKVVAPDHAPRLMTLPEQRCALMREEGIEQVLILPFNAIPNCTNDAMFGIPSLMQNVYAYSNPFYVTTDGIRFSQIVFGVIPVDNTKPLQFGFRIKYEEDAAVTNRYNPKKIAGQVTVPKPSFFSAALEHETEGRGEHEHEPKGRGERRTKK